MILKIVIILWIVFIVISAMTRNAASNMTPKESARAELFKEYPKNLTILALLKVAVGVAALVATIVWIIGL